MALMFLLVPPVLAAGEGASGEWLGSLDVGAAKLRLGLHIESKDGRLAAVLDSIDQGAKIPVGSVVYESGTLRLEIPAVGATYEGTISVDGSALLHRRFEYYIVSKKLVGFEPDGRRGGPDCGRVEPSARLVPTVH